VTSSPHRCLATTTPGLEHLLAAEVAALGHEPVVSEGGVEFDADTAGLARALVGLRTAHRVTVRLATFKARTFAELERHADAVDWSRVLTTGAVVHFRITSKKSRLYHEDGIAERLERAVARRIERTSAVRAASAAEDLEADVTQLPTVQRFVVRLFRDEVTISADASGGLLHRRGWRQEVAKAPLRESLAAAMLIGVRWDGSTPLHDPFCGSGTIAIEAALLARRMAPGRARRFAAERWPSMGVAALTAARESARSEELPSAGVRISGSDRDSGAVAAARANAERAGVAADVEFGQATVSELPADHGTGLIITNPPYGVRVSERDALRNLYASLGTVMRQRRPDWQFAMLSAAPMLDAQLKLTLREVWRTTNGGIPVRLVTRDEQAQIASSRTK
jgi:putative N6-adenine-specific DNA methylase